MAILTGVGLGEKLCEAFGLGKDVYRIELVADCREVAKMKVYHLANKECLDSVNWEEFEIVPKEVPH